MICFIVIIVLLVLLYSLGTRNHKYWQQRGIKHEKPLPFIGSIGRVLSRKVSLCEYLTEVYQKHPGEKFVRYFGGSKLGLVIRDPELVKHVLVTDFQHFYARAVSSHKTVTEPMFKNLFCADGDLWKLLRQRMTPAFTSGKLKAMFPLIVERTERLQRTAAAAAERGAEVDVRDLMARYTTDFIGACGFGIDIDSINHDDSHFRALGKRIFSITLREGVISGLKWTFPETFKHLHVIPPVVERDIVALVKGIIQKRNYKPSGRNDFIDLLFELKAKGVIIGESLEKRNPDGTPQTVELELDELLMAAQVFIFFAAGFETSSSATSYTLHQLALHPDTQTKCQQEIDEVLSRYDGKLCYDAVQEMKYLQMCFKEAMRMFPSLGYLVRQSVRPYTFPGTDLTIDGGVYVLIPVQGLHTDENGSLKYLSTSRIRTSFNPSGLAREHPIYQTMSTSHLEKDLELVSIGDKRAEESPDGELLGLMQSLAGLAALLRQFSVAPSTSTRRRLRVDPTTLIVQNILDGLPLSLIPRVTN